MFSVSGLKGMCVVYLFFPPFFSAFFFDSFQLPPHLLFISALKASLLPHCKVLLLQVCPNTFSVPCTELKRSFSSLIFISFTKSTSKTSSPCLCNNFLLELFPPSMKFYVLSWLSASQMCVSVPLFSQKTRKRTSSTSNTRTPQPC